MVSFSGIHSIYSIGIKDGGPVNTYTATKWNGSSWSTIGLLNNFTDVSNRLDIPEIVVDKTGNLYAGGTLIDGSYEPVVFKWDGSHWTQLSNFPEFAQAGQLTKFFVDRSNQVYAVIRLDNADFLFKWNGANWSQIGSIESAAFPNGLFLSVEVDNVGNLYAAVQHSDESYGQNIHRVEKWGWAKVG
jgi:hypothetical protein